jgi:hypothetical protein
MDMQGSDHTLRRGGKYDWCTQLGANSFGNNTPSF